MLIFSPGQNNQIGAIGYLYLDMLISCNRCFGKVPGPGVRKAIYLGKNEDGVYHATCDEFQLQQPIPCPFCGGFITTMYMREPAEAKAE